MPKTKKQLAEDVRHLADRLESVVAEVNALADEVEGQVMKKTTQRSPEWRGGANC